MMSLTGSLTESESVAVAATSFMGSRYSISRELRPGFIDCSTLASQAHWLGGGIRIPFRAEAQLQNTRGVAVHLGDLKPGDLVFAYPSARHSPGGLHNHVALYLGRGDDSHPGYVIESRHPSGVGIRALGEAQQGGGFRRYCPNADVAFAGGIWQELARRVPKLARLGARLTSATSTSWRRHLGTDLLLDGPTPVRAPIDGVVTRVVAGRSLGPSAIELEATSDWPSIQVLGPWDVFYPSVGSQVRRGESLGISSNAYMHGCNVLPLAPRWHRLHWEVWSESESGAEHDPSLDFGARMTGIGRDQVRARAHNPIYLVKLGRLHSPVLIGERAPRPIGHGVLDEVVR